MIEKRQKKTKMIGAYELKEYIYHLMEYREKNNEKPSIDLYTLLGHIVCLIEQDEEQHHEQTK